MRSKSESSHQQEASAARTGGRAWTCRTAETRPLRANAGFRFRPPRATSPRRASRVLRRRDPRSRSRSRRRRRRRFPFRRDARLVKRVVVVVGVNERSTSSSPRPRAAAARRPSARASAEELGDQHERAARERRGRVRGHLQKPLHHRRGARRPRVVLERAEGEAEQRPAAAELPRGAPGCSSTA